MSAACRCSPPAPKAPPWSSGPIPALAIPSQHYTAKVRLVPWGDFMNPDGEFHRPDRLVRGCAQHPVDRRRTGQLLLHLEAFPGLEGPPDWLTSPASLDDLTTDTGYYYLAGALIQNGIVNAEACLDGGLQAANVATACGVEAARPYLVEWQNRFDGEILQVSSDTGVPAAPAQECLCPRKPDLAGHLHHL